MRIFRRRPKQEWTPPEGYSVSLQMDAHGNWRSDVYYRGEKLFIYPGLMHWMIYGSREMAVERAKRTVDSHLHRFKSNEIVRTEEL